MRTAEATLPVAWSEAGADRLARFLACLRLLTLRAVKVRYRRSVLGFLWSMLSPLASMAVLTLVFSRVFPEVPAYALYVVVGVLAWNFFSVSCVQAMEGLLGASEILRKVPVQAAVFPLAAIGANLVNLLLAVLLLPLVMAATGAAPGFHPVLLVAGLAALVAFTTGVALALSAAHVFFHDVRYFFDALALVWFYASPIVYPPEVIPEHARWLLTLNPVSWLLALVRAPLYDGVVPPAAVVAGALGWAALSLVLGWSLFARMRRRFYLYL